MKITHMKDKKKEVKKVKEVVLDAPKKVKVEPAVIPVKEIR